MNLTRKKYKDDNLTNISVLSKILVMIKKYGLKNVISALFVFVVFILTIITFLNQGEIVNKVISQQTTINQRKEVEKMEFRIRVVNPRVDAILYELIAKTKCDRAFVIEMHNGTDNPSGLPFVYGDMTYEKTINDAIPYVTNQYEKINLSTVPMASYLYKNKYFIGDLADVEKIDPNLAKRLKFNDMSYIELYSVRGSNITLGILGISYVNPQPKKIIDGKGCLLDASQRLSILLDISSNIKEE